jgi:hypothetical protein
VGCVDVCLMDVGVQVKPAVALTTLVQFFPTTEKCLSLLHHCASKPSLTSFETPSATAARRDPHGTVEQLVLYGLVACTVARPGTADSAIRHFHSPGPPSRRGPVAVALPTVSLTLRIHLHLCIQATFHVVFSGTWRSQRTCDALEYVGMECQNLMSRRTAITASRAACPGHALHCFGSTPTP